MDLSEINKTLEGIKTDFLEITKNYNSTLSFFKSKLGMLSLDYEDRNTLISLEKRLGELSLEDALKPSVCREIDNYNPLYKHINCLKSEIFSYRISFRNGLGDSKKFDFDGV